MDIIAFFPVKLSKSRILIVPMSLSVFQLKYSTWSGAAIKFPFSPLSPHFLRACAPLLSPILCNKLIT